MLNIHTPKLIPQDNAGQKKKKSTIISICPPIQILDTRLSFVYDVASPNDEVSK